MSSQLTCIMVLLSCIYFGGVTSQSTSVDKLRTVRDTRNIPTFKFQAIGENAGELHLSQHSTAVVHFHQNVEPSDDEMPINASGEDSESYATHSPLGLAWKQFKSKFTGKI